MTTDAVEPGVALKLDRPGSTPRPKLTMDGQKKLPRPIVFWSLNEKTAYRRNRVVQTRMNMIMDVIVSQRESSRRWIRYEAHKFRQRSGKYFSHPGVQSSENQSANIAPPGWVDKHVNTENGTKCEKGGKRADSEDSDYDYDEDVSNVNDKLKSRTSGIITKGRKPVVKFSVNERVQDLPLAKKEGTGERDDEKIQTRESYVRSMSALQYRETNDFPEQILTRQKSAIAGLSRNAANGEGVVKQKAGYTEITPLQTSSNGSESSSPRLSDKFFDRSKAAYELRLDLKRRASLRRKGITTSIFTVRDALQMEREKLSQSREKIVNYMDRVEAIKRAERTVITKWNRGAFEQQLSL